MISAKGRLAWSQPGFGILLLGLLVGSAQAAPFTKITTGDAVTDGKGSRSAGWIDVDNDGDLDLFITNGKSGGENNMFYRNDGTGTLTQETSLLIAQDGKSSDGATWGDFNNDGYIDLFVANWYNQNGLLYRNDSAAGWTQLVSEPPSGQGFSEAGSWADYDQDGYLDLFVANSGGSLKNYLFHNDGDGTFTKIDTGVVSTDAFASRHGSWGDFDNDGDLDLYVANESGAFNSFYRNVGGAFQAITTGPPVSYTAESWSASWGDMDNDQDLDLFVTAQLGGTNRLFRNDGLSGFTEILVAPLTLSPTYSASATWVDYDNDADLDLFIARGWGPTNSTKQKNQLFNNDGLGNFTLTTGHPVVTDSGWSYGSAWGDYDGDGDLDLAVARWQFEAENNSLYRNDTGSFYNWIQLDLLGVQSNNTAIGARVYALAVVDGLPRWQMRELSSQDGYCTQNSPIVQFGLKTATTIDSLRVRWPSGQEDIYTGVSANQRLRVVEGVGLCGGLDSDRDGAVDPGETGLACVEDNCPTIHNVDQADSDGDGVGDVCDNCPNTFNPGQEDANSNGVGDLCDLKIGDANHDGVHTSADIIYLVNYIFKGGPAPLPVAAVGNVNCDLNITSADIIYMVNYIFKGGAAPCG